MSRKRTKTQKHEAPVAVAFVVIGLLLAYLVTSFTYGEEQEDGVIDFSSSTRTAQAGVSSSPEVETSFGTKAADILSQFGTTPTVTRTATSTPVTPTSTPVSTEERRRREDPPTATKTPPPKPTRKPPTSTGTDVPTQKSGGNSLLPPLTPTRLQDGSLEYDLYSPQGPDASLQNISCRTFLCRLVSLFFGEEG